MQNLEPSSSGIHGLPGNSLWKLRTSQQPALTLFAMGMVGLGVIALVYGDFALVWQPVPAWIPGRTALAYGCGVLMILVGIGLVFRSTTAWSVRVLFPYLIAWALLKVPSLIAAPQIEAVWLGMGELTVLLAGGWVLFARLAGLTEKSAMGFFAGDRGVRMARVLFGISLIPIGLSHILYAKQTADFVPAWLPFRIGWAYLTGAGQIACGLGVLLSVYPRLAARVEAGMLSLFTLLVWGPQLFTTPKQRLPWTAFFISWVITAAAWVVAQNMGTKGTFATEGPPKEE